MNKPQYFIKPISSLMLNFHCLIFKDNNIFYLTDNKIIYFNSKDEIKIALKHLYEKKINGWWSYSLEYIEYKICSKEQCRKDLMEDD